MPQTDAQRRAKNKYDAIHYTMIGCKVRKDYAARFRAACAALDTTPAAILKAAADALLAQYETNTRDDEDPGGIVPGCCQDDDSTSGSRPADDNQIPLL